MRAVILAVVCGLALAATSLQAAPVPTMALDRTAFAARVNPRPPVVVGEIPFATAMRFAADSLLEEEGFEPPVPVR